MILVTGATGTIGGDLLVRLCSAGAPVRALVRSPERGDDLRGYDCELAVGRYDDRAALDAALRGVDRVFLVSRAGERQVEEESAVIDAVGRAGGAHVVKVGAIGCADPDQPFGRFVASHARL